MPSPKDKYTKEILNELPKSELWRLFIDGFRQKEGKYAFDRGVAAEKGYYASMERAWNNMISKINDPISVESLINIHNDATGHTTMFGDDLFSLRVDNITGFGLVTEEMLPAYSDKAGFNCTKEGLIEHIDYIRSSQNSYQLVVRATDEYSNQRFKSMEILDKKPEEHEIARDQLIIVENEGNYTAYYWDIPPKQNLIELPIKNIEMLQSLNKNEKYADVESLKNIARNLNIPLSFNFDYPLYDENRNAEEIAEDLISNFMNNNKATVFSQVGSFPKEEIENAFTEYQSNISSAKSDQDKILAIAQCVGKIERAHPFYDGNCRTMILLTNKLLLQNGLSPTIYNNPNQMDMLSKSQLAEKIIEGQKTYAELCNNVPSKKFSTLLNQVKRNKISVDDFEKNLKTTLSDDPLNRLNEINYIYEKISKNSTLFDKTTPLRKDVLVILYKEALDTTLHKITALEQKINVNNAEPHEDTEVINKRLESEIDWLTRRMQEMKKEHKALFEKSEKLPTPIKTNILPDQKSTTHSNNKESNQTKAKGYHMIFSTKSSPFIQNDKKDEVKINPDIAPIHTKKKY